MLAIQAIWITSVGIGAGGFLAGSTRIEEVFAFAVQFALALAISAVVALVVGGRKQRALEVLVSIAILIAGVAIVAYTSFWLAPSLVRHWFRFSGNDILFLRIRLWMTLKMIASPVAAIGVGLGVGIGIVAGLVMRLARRRPRVAGALAVGLLIAYGASANYLSISLTDFVLELRTKGGNWRVSSISATELASAIGAATGSVVGAILACGTLQERSRRNRMAPEARLPGMPTAR